MQFFAVGVFLYMGTRRGTFPLARARLKDCASVAGKTLGRGCRAGRPVAVATSGDTQSFEPGPSGVAGDQNQFAKDGQASLDGSLPQVDKEPCVPDVVNASLSRTFRIFL